MKKATNVIIKLLVLTVLVFFCSFFLTALFYSLDHGTKKNTDNYFDSFQTDLPNGINQSSNSSSISYSNDSYFNNEHSSGTAQSQPPQNASLALMSNYQLNADKIQDGCVFGQYLFIFNSSGECLVLDAFSKEIISSSYLPKYRGMVPHSNSVCFGKKYSEVDEFPLLYSNIYNNYRDDEDSYGMCFVYRISRSDTTFSFFLVQIIKIAFTNNSYLWSDNSINVSPFGNFVINNDKLWVFVNIFGSSKTRFFEFNLPSVLYASEPQFVYLGVEDLIIYKDCFLFRYIQGCTFLDNCIFSLEGFGDKQNPPYLRIIDISSFEVNSICLSSYIGASEPEMITCFNNHVLIANYAGELFVFDLF